MLNYDKVMRFVLLILPNIPGAIIQRLATLDCVWLYEMAQSLVHEAKLILSIQILGMLSKGSLAFLETASHTMILHTD
jgi:hypothetical protein